MKSYLCNKMADRVKRLVDPTVQNTLKMASQPGIISLAGGMPNPKLFPITEIGLAMDKILKYQGERILQYSRTGGTTELKKIIAGRLSDKWQKQVNEDEVLITTGSQQALDLLGKAFLDKNDLVITENPTYLVAISAFNGYEVKYATVELLEDGVDINQLENIINKFKGKIKFIYVIPTFQNPSGVCWSNWTRKKVIALIRKNNCILIEDDPYSELYFDKKPPQSLAVYSHKDLVIYLGTFSKTLCPGLRIGYIVANKELINKLCLIKQGMDLHSPTLSQAIVANLLKNKKNYNIHLKKLRKYYKSNCCFMLKCLSKYLKNKAYWTVPMGGLFVWVTIPGVDCRKFYQKSILNGVAFMPGYAFYATKTKNDTIRLSYATVTKNEINEGIKKLSRLLE
ncbi:MAG: PLP-dependent aminotransferase family protein [Candidatus Beckwithbacteria bacterium]|nr:PLP-dependent aminotransferase family protein [Patescibacteria group bacterium]